MSQGLYTYVASVYTQCFICFFRRMLQVCLCRYCICFTHMLQVFYLDIAYVCNCFSCVFACVSGACFECFNYFVRMLQLFYLDVSKVDRGCCACCNMSHLPQLPVAVAGAPCMEGSGSAVMKGHGEAWGSGASRPHLCVQQVLAWALQQAWGPSER